ncbi:MAG: hypothetical protein ACYDH6_08535 [Acidimicrobiales bacterium]
MSLDLLAGIAVVTFSYVVCGLVVEVPFSCPALVPDRDRRAPDVTVTEGRVPWSLAAPEVAGPGWEAGPGQFLLAGGPRGGRFLVAGGKVVFERGLRGEDAVLARTFTDGVVAAVLRQRGMLVLHATAAVGERGAVVIMGESGVGKSTTLAALLNQGWRMVSDDVTALRLGPTGSVEVLPGVAQTHLTAETVVGLSVSLADAQRQPWRRMKMAVPTADVMANGPAPVSAMVLIDGAERNDVAVRELTGNEKFGALNSAIYGPLVPADHLKLFPLLVAAASTVPLVRVERPWARWSVDEVISAIRGVLASAP